MSVLIIFLALIGGGILGSCLTMAVYKRSIRTKLDDAFKQFEKELLVAEKMLEQHIAKARQEVGIAAGEGSNGKGRL